MHIVLGQGGKAGVLVGSLLQQVQMLDAHTGGGGQEVVESEGGFQMRRSGPRSPS